MKHFSVDEKVHGLGRSFREFRIRIECVGNPFEPVELDGHLGVSQPLEETLAAFDRHGDVGRTMENDSRWKTRCNVSDR